MASEKEFLNKIKEYAKSYRWTKNDGYWDHTLHVRKWSMWLQKKLGGNKFVIEAAAYLHDIGKSKGRDALKKGEKHARISASMTDEFLSEQNIENETKERILDAIIHHYDFTPPKLLESRIICAADKMAIYTDNQKARRWYGKELSEEERKIILDIEKRAINSIEFGFARKAIEPYRQKLIKKYSG